MVTPNTSTQHLIDLFRNMKAPAPSPELALVMRSLEQLVSREDYMKLEELLNYALQAERERAFLTGAKTLKEILWELE